MLKTGSTRVMNKWSLHFYSKHTGSLQNYLLSLNLTNLLNMKKPEIILLFTLIIGFATSCSNQQRTNATENSTTQKEKDSHDSISTREDTIELKSDTVINSNIIQNETEFKVKYLEDFASFKSHDEVVDYFGEDQVSLESENFKIENGKKVSYIYPNYVNMVGVFWEISDQGDYVFRYVTNYEREVYGKIRSGGSKYTYRSGLSLYMSLEELIVLNEKPIEFYDFNYPSKDIYYSGLVVRSSLKDELKDYVIILSYRLEDLDNFPEDYIFLRQGKKAWSNDDNIDKSKIYVGFVSYCPCRCDMCE